MKPLAAGEVHVLNTKCCTVNKSPVPLLDLPSYLTSQKNGFYEVQLFGNSDNVDVTYEISVEISSEGDLRLVETDFAKALEQAISTKRKNI